MREDGGEGAAADAAPQTSNKVSIELDWGLFYVFEIELEQLRETLVEGVAPAVKRPGITEILVNVAHVAAGGSGIELEDAWEIDWSLRVEAQPGRHEACAEVEEPLTAQWIRNVCSANPVYVDTCRGADYPIFAAADLHFVADDQGPGVTVEDAAGPILSFTFDGAAGDYRRIVRHGQEVVMTGDGVYRYDYRLAAEATLWRGAEARVQLHEHPFFAALDLGRATPICCEQMALRPNWPSTVTYFSPSSEE